MKEKIELQYYGNETCKSGHSFGPAIREVYLLHFVEYGEGYLYSEEKTYHIGENQGFLIYPDQLTKYEADKKNPWRYHWIGFKGDHIDNILEGTTISSDEPIVKCRDIQKIIRLIDDLKQSEEFLYSEGLFQTGILNMILSEVIKDNLKENIKDISQIDEKKRYFEMASDYISQNYCFKVSINDIAEELGVNRNYLYQSFIQYAELSPQEYLIEYRMKKSKKLLSQTDLSIGDISRSVGYADQLMFSKLFKKKVGVSPSQYRKVKTDE